MRGEGMILCAIAKAALDLEPETVFPEQVLSGQVPEGARSQGKRTKKPRAEPG
jgi:hypothetical protein